MRDGSKRAVEATDLRSLSNLEYANGIRPLLEGAGKTKAGPDSKLVPRLPSSPELNVNKMNIITT